mmetsp:Transcript_28650/g.85223  ORF Transcript_28650/g.85223 Transcript_28650/m.85223 type:complete len:244 (-) Transcript_28650:16-747(-)
MDRKALPTTIAFFSSRSEIHSCILLVLFLDDTTAPQTHKPAAPRPSPMIVRTTLSHSSSKSSCRTLLSILATHRPPRLHVSSSQAGAMSFLKTEKSIMPSFEGLLMLLKSRQKSSTALNVWMFICDFCQDSLAPWLCNRTHRHHVLWRGCFCPAAPARPAANVSPASCGVTASPPSLAEPDAVEAVTPAMRLDADCASSSMSFSAVLAISRKPPSPAVDGMGGETPEAAPLEGRGVCWVALYS